MVGGFVVSPALCSIATFLFGVNALWGVHPRYWLRHKWWLLGVAWVALFALTWFWSADKHTWEVRFQVKLAILLLPLAFAYMPRFSARQYQVLTLGMGLFLLAGAGYSLSYLIRDPATYIAEYRFSHLLPTPAGKDHVRFSLAISLYIIWGIYAWPLMHRPAVKWCLGICLTILTLYIHILAAKSGLVSLYMFLGAWSLYLVFGRQKLAGIIVIAAIPILVFLAMKYLPTFSARKHYVFFSWRMLKSGDKSGNYGDIGRLMSYDIALRLIKQHPLTGVGAGDMLAEMKKGYDAWYPLVDEKARLLPHNQFLTIGLGAGVPVMLLFTIWMFMPLAWIRRNRQSFFFFMVWLIVLLQVMIEPVLEVQYGVFVCLFFLLLHRQELPQFVQRGEGIT
jgi:O-antigen ligase